MSVSLRTKTRAAGGAAGAPAALLTGEQAYNMADGKVYIGYGDDGSGNATSIKVIARDDWADPATLFQPLDTDLSALAALATTGLVIRTGAATYSLRAITGTAGRVTVADGNGVAGPPTIDLDTVSVGGTVTGGFTKFTHDAYGRINNAGAASLTDLNTPTADFSMNGHKLTNLTDGSNPQDAVTLAQLTSVKAAIKFKDPARAAATGNVNVANPGTATYDTVVLAAGEPLLLFQQTAPAENGKYTFNGAGVALTRTIDMDSWTEIVGAVVGISEGATLADTARLFTVDAGGTLGTSAINSVSFGGGTIGAFTVAGAGLTNSGTTIDVATGAGITITSDAVALTGQALALHTLTTAADKGIYATGSGTFATYDLTAVGRTLLAQTTQALMRSTGLGLGTMSTQNANAVAITGGTIDGVVLDGGTF